MFTSRGNTDKSTIFIINFILTLSVSESYQQQRPRIISGPSHPLISTSQGNATFNWTFVVWPGMTWNERVDEVVFGVWKPSGILDPKLLVVTKQGDVLIRANFEKKVSCEFNTSRLQVAFILHNLSVLDQKQYGFQVEFGLAYNPLTDAVMLRLQDPPKIISRLKRNFYTKTGASLNLTCAAKGLPNPQVTWMRLGRQIKNHTLVFKQLKKEDSGLYLCKASNVAGEDTMEVNVTVSDEEESKQTEANHPLMPNTRPSTTTSEHSSDHMRMVVWPMVVLMVVLLIVIMTFLYYHYRNRLKRGSPYNRHVDDSGTPSSHSTSLYLS